MNCPNCNSTAILSTGERGERRWRRPRIAACARCRSHFDPAGVRLLRESGSVYDLLPRLF